MDMKMVLERLEKLQRVIETCSTGQVLREIDLLKLDIEIDCRRAGVVLVTG